MALRDRQTGRQGSLGWKAAFLAGVRGQSDRQFGVVRDPAQRQTLVERRFEHTPLGVKNIWRAILPNGRATESATEVVFPTEHLVPGDQGIGMIRRRLRAELKQLAEGRNPVGVSFDSDAPPLCLEGGRSLAPIPQTPVAS
jgi:hypothetical protein